MNNVWIIEWVCYPYIDGIEERYIEKVYNSKDAAIKWCNDDEDFKDDFLVVGEEQDKFFQRYRDKGISHYEISCWDIEEV